MVPMFFKKELQPCKVVNGFYIREKKHSDLQIGRQKMDAERVYMYQYNPETGKSVFYPYNGTIVHANSLDELRNAMRREYSYLKRIDK